MYLRIFIFILEINFFISINNNTVGLMKKINFIFYKIIVFHILGCINFTSVFRSIVDIPRYPL